MLDRPNLIQPRALRYPEVHSISTATAVPRLWPALPIPAQIQVARQWAQMLRRAQPPRSPPTKEGNDADHDDRR
jgi:hypothetical protein